ncbi:MAG: tRNA (N(6)-L-threonylcarbamoyladenosine(37)-C(2))-methylthiotransferase MtaB [Acidobacteriaceae bacterium]
MSNFHILNFGCRATQADGAAIEREMLASGLLRTDETSASVVVLNSCTVTAAADADVRAAVRRIHRNNPLAKILVTGCYAQRAPQELAALPGVAWVVGNSHKSQVAGIAASAALSAGAPVSAPPHSQTDHNANEADEPGNISALISLDQIAAAEEIGSVNSAAEFISGDIFAHTEVLAAPVFEGDATASGFTRTRANLKVQDGCNNRCSFCIIPFVRGNSRSLSTERVIAEAEQLVRAGFQEIVLSGINLGRWGRDFERHASSGRNDRFVNLLRYLLNRTAIAKLRISSVEPMDWSDELIELVAQEPRIAKHAHLPLQSGSDRILRQMHRKYRPWHYEEKVTKIRAAMPDAAVGADVMVGFPGESDELFRETYDFIARLPFTYLHVFSFSPRPGTPAAMLPDQVPVQCARQRNRLLRDLIAQKNAAFRRGFVGRTLEAIILSRSNSPSQPGAANVAEALTSNFIKLTLDGDRAPNQWITSQVTALTEAGLHAHLA